MTFCGPYFIYYDKYLLFINKHFIHYCSGDHHGYHSPWSPARDSKYVRTMWFAPSYSRQMFTVGWNRQCQQRHQRHECPEPLELNRGNDATKKSNDWAGWGEPVVVELDTLTAGRMMRSAALQAKVALGRG